MFPPPPPPNFIVFFASKMDVVPLNRNVLGGPLRRAKRTNGDFGVVRPRTAKMPRKQGKRNKTKICHHMDRPYIGQKMTLKRGQNVKRTNGSIFIQPQRVVASMDTYEH